jgi:hypothetical protein
MLRFVVFDAVFFDLLQTYGATYAYGNAVTADFQAVGEAESGQDLDWFFDQWIYDQGFPEYDLLWSSQVQGAKGYDLSLAIFQQQENAPIFTMPMELGITTASGEVLDTILVDEAVDVFQLTIAEEPLDVQIDPNRWLLCERAETQVSDTTAPEVVGDLAIFLEGGAKVSAGDVRLRWAPSSDDVAVAGYIVYRSSEATSLGDSLATVADTTFLDVGAAGQAGMNYFYTVKAVDWVGNASPQGNQVGEFDRDLVNSP